MHTLNRDGEGPWSIVVSLSPGRHTYAFVVDDELWVADENAPRTPEDEFGRVNSVVLVEESSATGGDHGGARKRMMRMIWLAAVLVLGRPAAEPAA